MKKKILLIGLMIALLLSGCNAPQAPTQTPTDATPQMSPTQPLKLNTATPTIEPTRAYHLDISDAQLQGTEISFAHQWTGETALAVEKLVSQFNRTNSWGIKVNVDAPGGYFALDEALNQQIADDAVPHLLALSPELLFIHKNELHWADVASYANDPVWGMTEAAFADIPASYLLWMNGGNVLAGLPAAPTLQVLIYNQSWARELGYDAPPQTLKEIEEQSCAALRANNFDNIQTNDGFGSLLFRQSPWHWLGLYAGFGAQIPSTNQTVLRFNTPEGEAAFTGLKSLYTKCPWTGDRLLPHQYFSERLTLIYPADLSEVMALAAISAQQAWDDAWLVLPYPSQTGQPISLLASPIYAIPLSDRVTQLASWLFMRWMVSPEAQNQFVRAAGSLPVSQGTWSMLDDFKAQHPQWAAAAALAEDANIVYVDESWYFGQWLLNDTISQIMLQDAGKIPGLLQFLDESLLEFTP